MVAQRLTLGVALALSVGALGACRAHVRATGHAQAEPTLVWVDGVWVVEDHHEPVFYHDHYYWRWYGGAWYRSDVHTGGWIRIDVVPDRVRRVERPEMYVRWRAEAGARRHTGRTPPAVVDEGSDHPGRGHGPPDHAPAHGVRGTQPGHGHGHGHDHGAKAEMKEEKAEAKAEAKAEKAEAKAEKAEAKAEAKAEKKAEKAQEKAQKAEVKAEVKAEKKQEKAEKAEAKAEVKAEKKQEKAEEKKVKEDKGGGKKNP